MISPYVGLSYNFVSSSHAYIRSDKSSPQIYQPPNINVPLSFIFCIDTGIVLGYSQRWVMFTDLRFVIDLKETEMVFSNYNLDFSFSGNSFDFSLGIKYFFQFIK